MLLIASYSPGPAAITYLNQPWLARRPRRVTTSAFWWPTMVTRLADIGGLTVTGPVAS